MSANTNIELLGYTDDELEAAFFDRFDYYEIKDMCYARDILEDEYDSLSEASTDELEDELEARGREQYDLEPVKWIETYLRAGDLENATAKLHDLFPVLEQYNVTLTKA